MVVFDNEATLTAAKVLYGRLTLVEYAGGDNEKISVIHGFLNEMLDAERLSSPPPRYADRHVSGHSLTELRRKWAVEMARDLGVGAGDPKRAIEAARLLESYVSGDDQPVVT